MSEDKLLDVTPLPLLTSELMERLLLLLFPSSPVPPVASPLPPIVVEDSSCEVGS